MPPVHHHAADERQVWNFPMVNSSVLLLNQNYEPLSVCTARKAIVLVYLGKAEVIEDGDGQIRSISLSITLPLVVRLKRYARAPRRRIILNRKNLLVRDNQRCQYCGRKNPPLTVDHVVPRQFGGKDSWENLVIACLPCNNKKANRTPEQADMSLSVLPRKPNHFAYFQHFIGVRNERWRPYLFLD